MAEIAVGDAIPWDVYAAGGSLLVRKGHLLSSENQCMLLLERGFIDDDREERLVVEAPSVVRLLNRAHVLLASALAAIVNAVPFGEQLTEVARLIMAAVELDAEVAMACILLNQHAYAYPIRHSVDTAVLALVAGRALKKNPDELLTLVQAALTMNVGMLAEHERLRAGGTGLNANDMAYIRAHPQAGVALLRQAGVDDAAWLACVLEHHENEDGSGYPSGKSGAQLSEASKIVGLADRYCARVSLRGYRKTMLPNAALRDILMEGKHTVDTKLATVFLRELGIFPTGTFVRLCDGEIGVVTRKGLNSTTPYVHALVGPRGAPLDVPLRRDTKIELHAIRDVLSADQAGVVLRLDQLWGSVARA